MLETTHFLDIDDLATDELTGVLDRAAAIESGADDARLEDQTLGMVFEKPSTRTRISFETGMTQLGGHAIFLGPDDIHLGRGEPLSDTSRVLSRYVDVVMTRLFDHSDLEEIAAYADVPVVNGLTDDAHPCQTLADLLTIREEFGGFDGVNAAWVGDGNNVAQSFVVGAAMAGLDVTVATPENYGIDDDVIAHAAEYGGEPTVAETPEEAVADADVVYTDVWISMGQEGERHEKLAAFEGYQVNEDLLSGTDAKVMHCLPAHRGEEISADVLESDRALVWDQAENRLHAQKGLLVELLEEAE
ncbi:ornithine carbamoyltransferase [Halogeometricum luteum]|uniref:Ornithine carbamoyltransferase n=1 Tax=Halogeometricum luteum TaxID=2950537 RepID=A0ABU2G6C9_9EURY|nr:ornithine carbamoyltransferase [Halogeometricum sp. S3BR5-2]MDS0296031.1 ornithine carbamoyltransferase [Halogeometricum sp. S3BR5-2]